MTDDPHPTPSPPPRPAAVELAAAILVVSGLVGLLNTIDLAARRPADVAGAEPVVLLGGALNLLTAVLGLLVRAGRGWLVAINVVAVVLFLELLSGPGPGLVFALLDGAVLVALFRHRDWFEARRRSAPFDRADTLDTPDTPGPA